MFRTVSNIENNSKVEMETVTTNDIIENNTLTLTIKILKYRAVYTDLLNKYSKEASHGYIMEASRNRQTAK